MTMPRPGSSRLLACTAIVLALAFGHAAPARAQRLRARQGVQSASTERPLRSRIDQTHTDARSRAGRGAHDRLSLRDTLRAAREELHVYRGERLERWADRMKVGRSDFDPRKSVHANLESLVKDRRIEHYYEKIDGRDVLHVVVNLAQGKNTRSSLRSVLRRVGRETIELNYKAASSKNPTGHVAVRVGDGALYDLTGTQGVAKLPAFMEKVLQKLRGTTTLTAARKRSLRRFMESRTDGPRSGASIYYGMLYAASPEEIAQTRSIYDQRIKDVKQFSVGGGDGKAGVFSCAQFLTEDVPFFNGRGVGRNIGARSTMSQGRSSLQLEAVIVYKMPSVTREQLDAL